MNINVLASLYKIDKIARLIRRVCIRCFRMYFKKYQSFDWLRPWHGPLFPGPSYDSGCYSKFKQILSPIYRMQFT